MGGIYYKIAGMPSRGRERLPTAAMPMSHGIGMLYHRQMKIRFLKISQVIDNQVIVKNIETENSIADGICLLVFILMI
jgi:hypothetical protein